MLSLCASVALGLSSIEVPTSRSAEPDSAEALRSEEAIGTTLEELNRSPSDWIGRRVRLVFQFHSAPAVWNPYLSRFGQRHYVAARCWSDAQILWRANEHASPGGMLFARRDSPAAQILARGVAYARYEAVGRVRQVFLGQGWIEVERLERLPEEVGEGAILHATRAVRSMEAGSWKLALEDLTRAASSNLPSHARAEIALLREECEALLAVRKLPGLR